MVVIDKPALLVKWEAKEGWMHFEFRGFIDGDEYRSALDTALDTIIANKVTAILWDLRGMKVLTPADQVWAESDWTPRLLKETKVRRAAHVTPQSTIAKMTLSRISARAAPMMGNEITNKYFSTVEDAKKWLRSGG